MSSEYLPPAQRPATGLFTLNGKQNTRFVNSPEAQKERQRAANYAKGANSRRKLLQIPHANYKKMTARLSRANQEMANDLLRNAYKNSMYATKEYAAAMPGALYQPGAFGNTPVKNTRVVPAPASGVRLHAPAAVQGGRRRSHRSRSRRSRFRRSH